MAQGLDVIRIGSFPPNAAPGGGRLRNYTFPRVRPDGRFVPWATAIVGPRRPEGRQRARQRPWRVHQPPRVHADTLWLEVTLELRRCRCYWGWWWWVWWDRHSVAGQPRRSVDAEDDDAQEELAQ